MRCNVGGKNHFFKSSISSPYFFNLFSSSFIFQIKIRLPITPLSTVDIAHGRAVAPPRVNLYAPDINPAGIPQ